MVGEEGYTIQLWWGGLPHPVMGGYPSSDGGTPSSHGGGTPGTPHHQDLGWVPPLRPEMGYPPPGMGYPHPQTWDRVPPTSVDRLKILPSLILRMWAVTKCPVMGGYPIQS